MDGDWRISRILLGRVAPDALDAIYQAVANVMTFKRADQTIDFLLMEFDVLCEKAESRMVMRSGFPVLCMQNAASPKLKNRWRWPVFAILWRPRRWQVRCRAALAAADCDAVPEEEDFAAWAASRKAKKGKRRGGVRIAVKLVGGTDSERTQPQDWGLQQILHLQQRVNLQLGGSLKEDGRTMNGLNRKTGERKKCYTCKSEYRLASHCARGENRPHDPSPYQTVVMGPPSQPYSPIATESPMHVRPLKVEGSDGPERRYEHSFSTTLEIGGQFVCARGDSVVALGASATANLACSKWLENHKSYVQKMGFPKVIPYPATARIC